MSEVVLLISDESIIDATFCAPLSFFSILPEKKDSAAPGVRKKSSLAWPQVATYGQNHRRRLSLASKTVSFREQERNGFCYEQLTVIELRKR